MKIGIDARFYSESGIGRYIRNLLLELSKLDHENEYFLFLNKNNYHTTEYGSNFKKVLANFGWYGISEQVKFPGLLNKYNLDLVHFPHFNVPIFYRGKFVVTIHDLIHEKFEMRRASTHDPIIYKLKHLGYRKVFRHAVKNAKRIITVSDYVKDELVETYNVPDEKIVVTKEGVDEKIVTIVRKITQKEINKTLEKFDIRPPFIFYVGNAHPHKNVEGLIKAFLEIKDSRLRGNDMGGLQLVLSGQDHYFWKRVKKSVQATGDSRQKDIVFTGYITDEELVALYKSAKVFVMPSFEEGFGIPILEAFTAGCPVVSSDAGSLKEVGGDAALYFDPHDTQDMVEKIMQVLNSDKLQKELVEKGNRRVKQFSWEKLAEETLRIYNNIK